MLFNSYIFWAFFAAVVLVYWRLPFRWQNWWLLGASYLFYGAWDWRFLTLIWLSTVVDFVAARQIAASDDPGGRRRWVTLSVVVNLGLLGIFKYYGFFAGELVALLERLGLPADLPLVSVVLPVGISFYTFQTMSYTIDVYRGVWQPQRRLDDFALYVCFFPQLVAGPIERSRHLMPIIASPRSRRPGDFAEGLYHVAIGLFKKVVIADNLAVFVDAVFSQSPDSLTGLEVIVGVWAFAFQIYGDFSGYSSIAQGVAKWLGVDLMFNFQMPYFAVSPSDFWRRWHISLSSWLRDYLYIPLGGNRGGGWATQRNLMLTMLLGGLWHGAGWTFVAWGAFHGVILIAYRPFTHRLEALCKSAASPWLRLVNIVVMFQLVAVSWLFFRAESISQAWHMMLAVVARPEVTSFAVTGLGLIAFFAGPMMVFEAWVERRGDMLAVLRAPWQLRAVCYAYVALMLLFFPPPSQHVFIYFQF